MLFLITILSVLCAIILKSELARRETMLRAIDDFKSQSAAENGITLSLSSPQPQNGDTTVSMVFDDGSSVEAEVYRWGLFTWISSKGISHKSESVRSALLAASIADSEKNALVLGNLQHGLVFTGDAKIIGDVAVGPMGVSTGSLRNYPAPRSIPISGKKATLTSPPLFFDTLALCQHVSFIRALFSRVRRLQANQDNSGNAMECNGTLDLHEVNDSMDYVFCEGSLSLMDTIMRRGPPLYIVVMGAVSFCPGTFVSGCVSICSKDSIVVPQGVSITNCILTSAKSIILQPNSAITAQVFSPMIHFSSNAVARYPSIAASVSFVDTSVTQNIQLDDAARVEGAVMMHRSAATTMDKAVIILYAGATVVGGVYNDAYLTMDGTVNGYVRTFDFYFYDSPTTYLGWMRQGVIDRALLPNGFLKPMGISRTDTMRVLSWM